MKTEVAIVGGGPGGTTCALFLARVGIKSIIIEKDVFPRFHIGESMTGECGNIVRELGLEEEMTKCQHPIKYGVKVYGSGGKNTFWVPVMGRSSKGELYNSSTWQVRRSDFDQMLLNQAIAQGTTVIQGQVLTPLLDNEGTVRGVRIRTAEGDLEEIASEVLIDASGQGTFLCNTGLTSKKERGNYNKQVAIFSHVKGALRDSGKERDNTLIFYKEKNHWAWFIPIDQETVSIGVVVPSDYFRTIKESIYDFLLREMRELNPELTRRVSEVDLVEETRSSSNYSYHIKRFIGKNYLCVGDAHRFIDPVFSFGLHFTMSEARKAAEAITTYMNGAHHAGASPFAEYQRYCERGQDVIQNLIDAFWNHPLAFSVFVHQRYVDDFIDMFAGRVYMDEPTRGLIAIHKINAKSRKRTYAQ